MPYIKKDQREKLKPLLDDVEYLLKKEGLTGGETNYLISSICHLCLKYVSNGENYATHNAIIGILECVKLEFYRRKTSEYEDKKIEENGDL